jgi:hypothetical protein
MPRFVVLLHETPAGFVRGNHFDLMLESGDALRTWALDAWPTPGETVAGERLLDHRPVYLDFEGDVAGDRGSVQRVAAGEYELMEESAVRLVVRLQSGELSGTLTLTKAEDDAQRWWISLPKG